MIFSFAYLISALAISAIAAYFSVIGLATIFPGAITAVVIMGGVLEIGKIITAIWLHRNWKTAPFLIRSYLCFAVFTLMGITSMGIFGFLSKAHIEHQVTTEKTQALAEQVEAKISREKEYIDRQQQYIKGLEDRTNQSASGTRVDIDQENARISDITSQMNKDVAFEQGRIDAVNKKIAEMKAEVAKLEEKEGGIFSNKKKKVEELKARQEIPLSELAEEISSYNRNITVFRTQAQDSIKNLEEKKDQFREKTEEKGDNLTPEIEARNKNIAESYDKIDALEKEKFNYQDNAKNLEAEVGPVKYVAELVADLTGMKFDISQAVRMVIVILIFVFDPLAILLVIAANISIAKHFPQPTKELKSLRSEVEKLDELKLELEEKEIEVVQKKEKLDSAEGALMKEEKDIENKLVAAGGVLLTLQDDIERQTQKKEELGKENVTAQDSLAKLKGDLREARSDASEQEQNIDDKLKAVADKTQKLKEDKASAIKAEARVNAMTADAEAQGKEYQSKIEGLQGIIDELTDTKLEAKEEKVKLEEEQELIKEDIKMQRDLIASLKKTYKEASQTGGIKDAFVNYDLYEAVVNMGNGNKLLSIRDSKNRIHQFVIPPMYSKVTHEYFHRTVEALESTSDPDDLPHEYAIEITKHIRGPRPKYNCLT
jgi:DNA repair exonuclease SbcCD ATPase subunit